MKTYRGKIFVHDAVGSSKEGQNVGEEESLVIGQIVKPTVVIHVGMEINLFGGPKTRQSRLVKDPKFLVFDRKQNESRESLHKQRLWKQVACQLGKFMRRWGGRSHSQQGPSPCGCTRPRNTRHE
jgi:hypothetical protein